MRSVRSYISRRKDEILVVRKFYVGRRRYEIGTEAVPKREDNGFPFWNIFLEKTNSTLIFTTIFFLIFLQVVLLDDGRPGHVVWNLHAIRQFTQQLRHERAASGRVHARGEGGDRWLPRRHPPNRRRQIPGRLPHEKRSVPRALSSTVYIRHNGSKIWGTM